MTAENAMCVECLGPVPMVGDAPDDDCPECGSGYWLAPTATVRELLSARAWVLDDNEQPWPWSCEAAESEAG